MKQKMTFFWNTLAFSMIQQMLVIFFGSSAFCKSSLNIWKFSVHVLLKPGLENFEHCFASRWDECNCVVVWTFFGVAFFWDWNENWPFGGHKSKIMVLSGYVPFGGFRGESISLFPQFLEAACIPWLLILSSISSAAILTSPTDSEPPLSLL